eukprot:m.174802 g.174802  ORF g.174802 m.174802 type:complete len:630 (-) comp17333_c0_seq3:126-2015(-)
MGTRLPISEPDRPRTTCWKTLALAGETKRRGANAWAVSSAAASLSSMRLPARILAAREMLLWFLSLAWRRICRRAGRRSLAGTRAPRLSSRSSTRWTMRLSSSCRRRRRALAKNSASRGAIVATSMPARMLCRRSTPSRRVVASAWSRARKRLVWASSTCWWRILPSAMAEKAASASASYLPPVKAEERSLSKAVARRPSMACTMGLMAFSSWPLLLKLAAAAAGCLDLRAWRSCTKVFRASSPTMSAVCSGRVVARMTCSSRVRSAAAAMFAKRLRQRARTRREQLYVSVSCCSMATRPGCLARSATGTWPTSCVCSTTARQVSACTATPAWSFPQMMSTRVWAKALSRVAETARWAATMYAAARRSVRGDLMFERMKGRSSRTRVSAGPEGAEAVGAEVSRTPVATETKRAMRWVRLCGGIFSATASSRLWPTKVRTAGSATQALTRLARSMGEPDFLTALRKAKRRSSPSSSRRTRRAKSLVRWKGRAHSTTAATLCSWMWKRRTSHSRALSAPVCRKKGVRWRRKEASWRSSTLFSSGVCSARLVSRAALPKRPRKASKVPQAAQSCSKPAMPSSAIESMSVRAASSGENMRDACAVLLTFVFACAKLMRLSWSASDDMAVLMLC